MIHLEEDEIEEFIPEFKPEVEFSKEIMLQEEEVSVIDWRMKIRLKTVHVAIVMCLNIGVDPPDVIKVYPCSVLECWLDPQSHQISKPLETIGNTLKNQYERWQPRARYKLCLDPTVEEVKKTCTSLRRSAKKERVLYHYNGHGVPKPTSNGEIWVFNKNFTQYIPLSIYDLHLWMSSPSVYVFDCPCAGLILKSYLKLLNKETMEENIFLGSCSINEILPTNPNFPADFFTSCLTTPIKTALRWFNMNNKLLEGISIDLLDNIPGKLTDRKTPMGELNWIFTAVTDTIAWSVLPSDLFHKLFRQDLLLASLFRNFLLANRIMRSVKCTPVSHPKLPPTQDHPLWQAWDLAVDQCVEQLPKLSEDSKAEYIYSSFFESQLTDFELWLDFASEKKKPPLQLPILLQVLLSQVHRLRALSLLARFLDLGAWAVNLALSVGIFPYVLKLLQSQSTELRKVLVFIWSRIIAVDKSAQSDLVKDSGHIYFINTITGDTVDSSLKALCCFVLCNVVDDYVPGKEGCFQDPNILLYLIEQVETPDPLLRKWICFLIAKIIEDYDEAIEVALSDDIHTKISELLFDSSPDVRTAAIYALSVFVGKDQTKSDNRAKEEFKIGSYLYQSISDGSNMTRRELVIALSVFLKSYEEFVSPELLRGIIFEDQEVLRQRSESIQEISQNSLNDITPKDMQNRDIGKRSYFALDLCRVILMLCSDPMKDVSELAMKLFTYMKHTFFKLSKTNSINISALFLTSTFFQSNCEDFSKSILESNVMFDKNDTPKIRWRIRRNKTVIKEAGEIPIEISKKKFEDQIGFLSNQSDIISNVLFHPFDPHLIVSDEKDRINVWNWISATKMNSFSCGKYLSGRITDLKLINESIEQSLLLVSSASGNICIFKNYGKDESLVTAFRAVPEAISYQQGPGIITAWQQQNKTLYCGGEIEFIKIWDIEKEFCVRVLPTNCDTSVTSMSCSKLSGNLCYVGCGDGSILLIDQRVNEQHSVVSNMKEHKNWIVNLKTPKKDENTLISGSGDGLIKFWDVRKPEKSIKEFQSQKGSLSALAIHDYASLIATGSSNQHIKVFNFNGDNLSTIYYHDGFLSQRIGPISALGFHPYKLCLAAGATDSIVSLYTNDKKMKGKIF